MEVRISGDVSLNVPVSDEEASDEREAFLTDNRPSQEVILAENQEYDLRRRKLYTALSSLNEREKDIFISRRLSEQPLTLEALSEKYNISRERVRQIEQRAYDKLCSSVLS